MEKLRTPTEQKAYEEKVKNENLREASEVFKRQNEKSNVDFAYFATMIVIFTGICVTTYLLFF